MKNYENKDWLYKKYWIEEQSIKRIAELEKCSISCIFKWMNRLNIQRRSPQKGWSLEDNKKYALYKNKKILYNIYITNKKSLSQTAKYLNCSVDTIRTWLRRQNIKIRHNKLSLPFIREKFEEEGYTLLSEEYVNSKQKLLCISPESEQYSVTWTDWKRGCRSTRKEIPKFATIKKSFEDSGCTLLSEISPRNSQEKLLYLCAKEHRCEISWNNWSRGERCKICFRERNRGNKHYKWKEYTESDLLSIENYHKKVWQETNQNFRKYYYLINPNKYRRGKNEEYQLDHIYSIQDGFENSVLPIIIASPINLRMLPTFNNRSKGRKSHITKEELLSLYNQFYREEYNQK